jgi:hypothetical protein
VHLPRQRRWVSAAWCSTVSVMDVACLDSRKAGALYGAMVVSMVGLVKGFILSCNLEMARWDCGGGNFWSMSTRRRL